MILLADFQPLSIAKINIFQQQPRFYSQICIVSKSMLVKRSRIVDTLRDAASFCSLSDGDRKSRDSRAPMIWDNFSFFRTNCAILTSYIRADSRTCRGLSRGCCHVV